MKFVYVFASNLKGIHSTGAALQARRFFGARMGVGEGITGRSYALPVKSDPNHCLSAAQIQENIAAFLELARNTPRRQYMVTRIVCLPAGLRDARMARLFADAPPNCFFPPAWKKFGLPVWEALETE